MLVPEIIRRFIFWFRTFKIKGNKELSGYLPFFPNCENDFPLMPQRLCIICLTIWRKQPIPHFHILIEISSALSDDFQSLGFNIYY